MIDNFDELIARCEARRRRHLIRFSLISVSIILFLIAAVSAYLEWIKPSSLILAPALQSSMTTGQKESDAASHTTGTVFTSAPAVARPSISAETKPSVPTQKASSKPKETLKKPSESKKPLIEKQPLIETASSKPKSGSLFEVDNASQPVDPMKAYTANPKYETALAVARDFYAKSDYSDAAVWAKKANQLNREAEEAWLLYARSYYALGRKTEAVGVLELYLNYKDSKAAKELLRSWKQAPLN